VSPRVQVHELELVLELFPVVDQFSLLDIALSFSVFSDKLLFNYFVKLLL
jgi:hypothetical protein